MARAQDQRRWRANTQSRRIELYLSPDVVDRLDALAAERGVQRPAVIASLIDAAASAAKPVCESTTERVGNASMPRSDTPAAEPPASSHAIGYKMRRPRSADEKRYDWIIVTDDGQRIALGPDPRRFWRWCGRYLGSSIFSREAKGNTRDEVAKKLIDWPDIYR